MGCDCGKPKCDGHCGISPAVLQINNPSECVYFHRVEVPASMGDSTTNPPKSGAYKNVLLYYEADQTSWLYSSDGIPQKLVNGLTNYEDAINLPKINGVTLIGDKSSASLKLADAPMVITIASGGVTWSGADTAEDIYNFFLNQGKVNVVFEGSENYGYEIVSAAYIPGEQKMACMTTIASVDAGSSPVEFSGNALYGLMVFYTAGKAVDVGELDLQPKLFISDFTGLEMTDGYVLGGVPATESSIGMVKIGNGLDVASDGTLSLDEQVAFTFDTVADMKAATNFINGSYARTLGFYAKNDGGGALYEIRDIANDDVVDGALIIEMGDGSDELVAELIVESPVNVRCLGAYGDGTHDDTDAIQLALDTFKHNTVYLPTGTYLISEPLSIGTANADQVDMELESGAVIKTNTTIDSLLEIGKYEGVYNRASAGSIVTISGGNFDCSNTTYGIYTAANRKLTTFKNVTLTNINHYGIYVNTGTNTSSSADVNIDGCFISGNGSNYDTTGLYLKAYDNKVNNTRIEGVRIGVEDAGGSFYQNVHALMTRANGSITTAEFEATVAFLFSTNAGSIFMNECYADTFATSFKITKQKRIQVSNSMAYWYYSDVNATTKFIAFSTNEGGHISFSDCEFNIPSNGTVKGLDLTGVTSTNVKQLASSNIFFFNNILTTGDASKLAKDDFLINRAFYKDNQVIISKSWTTTMTKDAYYPIAYLHTGVYKFDVRMANDQYIEAVIKVDSGGSTITTTNKYNGSHSGMYKLALCNGGTDANSYYGALLCVTSGDSNSYLNPAIIGGLQSWNCDIHSCYNYLGKLPLTSPTVIVEASFNP